MSTRLLAAALCLVAVACSRGDEGSRGFDTAAAPPAADDSRGIPDAELEAAARDVVAFLRGEAPFEQLELADTIVLHVSPEGGGTRSLLARDALRRPSDWIVSSGPRRVPIAPPAGSATLTTRVGRHLNCMEYSLASRVEELAHLPHVGTKLAPDAAASCLQTWNLTLVFDSTARPPRLVAAVYDQWEW